MQTKSAKSFFSEGTVWYEVMNNKKTKTVAFHQQRLRNDRSIVQHMSCHSLDCAVFFRRSLASGLGSPPLVATAVWEAADTVFYMRSCLRTFLFKTLPWGKQKWCLRKSKSETQNSTIDVAATTFDPVGLSEQRASETFHFELPDTWRHALEHDPGMIQIVVKICENLWKYSPGENTHFVKHFDRKIRFSWVTHPFPVWTSIQGLLPWMAGICLEAMTTRGCFRIYRCTLHSFEHVVIQKLRQWANITDDFPILPARTK